jgi:putative ABC transport system substrate-binding protein
VRRRLLLSAAASALPFGLRAQPTTIPTIGWLSGGGREVNVPFAAAFRQGLASLGYVEGKTVAIEYRWAEGHYDQLPALAAELVERKVALIVANGNPAVPRAAKAAAPTLPIVFSGSNDPVADGLVASLARPGGNVTGVTSLTVEINAKRFELLRELVPQAGTVALLVNPENANTVREVTDVEGVARARTVPLVVLKAATGSAIEAVFTSLARGTVGGMIVQNDQLFIIRRHELAALAARHAVPAIYPYREYVAAGGLMSYGPRLTGQFRQSGIYAGQILKGARPADLPVWQPTTFELVVDLRVAQTLGLIVPPSILTRADEVIE